MKQYFLYTAMVATLLTAGCRKEMESNNVSQDEVRLSFTVDAGVQAGVDTRVAADGRKYHDLTSLTLFVEAHNDPHKDWYFDHGYDNIQGAGSARIYSGSYLKWSFLLNGLDDITANRSSYLGLFTNKGDVSIYGFYPKDNDFDPRNGYEIPFEVGSTSITNIDYCRITPIDINPAAVPSTVQLQMHHVMTALEFRLKKSYTGSLKLKVVTVELIDNGGTPLDVFKTKGTYNVKTGVVTSDGSTANSISIPFETEIETTLHSEYQYYPFTFIFPEIDFSQYPQAAKLKVKFEFMYMGDGEVDGELYGSESTLEIDLSQIVDVSDTPITGFLQNKMYVFPITIDNFIKYHMGPPTTVPWGKVLDGDGNEVETEIKV